LWQQAERALAAAAASSAGGGGGRWEEVEGAWVLRPLTPARGVVHFIGGAFAGAAPQLTYRLLLETLSAEGSLLVVATPFATSFDHLAVADQCQFCYDRAARSLALPAELPVWGLGHSMGSLAQTLIASRYASRRAGNILLSASARAARP